MKKLRHFLMGAALLASQVLSAQYSVTFKPDAALGEDAVVYENSACPAWADNNYGMMGDVSATAWTWYANGCGPGTIRSLIRFSQLNTLPAGAVITYAELRLFGLASNGGYGGSSYYPGSPHPSDNGAWVRRVISGWGENTVTWNTQPSYTTVDEAVAPPSTSEWNYNVSVNVTNQVIAMLAPGANNGFMVMLQNENYYRSLLFASSDYAADPNLWPELFIKYDLPCDANFTYCTSTQTPGLYNFKVDNPQPGLTYRWDFGDGTSAIGTSAWHRYVDGSYQVCLNAYDEEKAVGCKKCIKICVTDVPDAPPCSVRFDYYSNGQAYYFDGYEDGVNGSVVSAEWDFGDGSPFTSENTQWPHTKHIYERPGTYLVCVKVKYENGCIAQYCLYVRVGDGAGKQSNKADNLLPKVTNAQIPPMDKVDRLAKADGKTPVADDIKVVPNPVDLQLIKVSLNVADAGNYKYALFNANGKAILSGNKPLNKGLQQVEISIQGVKAGKYWIEFSNGKKQLRAGFVRL